MRSGGGLAGRPMNDGLERPSWCVPSLWPAAEGVLAVVPDDGVRGEAAPAGAVGEAPAWGLPAWTAPNEPDTPASGLPASNIVM